jgi:hypothetical protein
MLKLSSIKSTSAFAAGGSVSNRKNNRALVVLALTLVLARGGVAMADLATMRTTQFLTALQNDDEVGIERVCPAAKLYMPQLKAGWQQQTAMDGKLKSFDIVSHSSS